jgi:hypothetical protein
MNRYVDGQTDRWADRQPGRQLMDSQTDGLMNEQMDRPNKPPGGQTTQMDRQTDGQREREKDG